MADDFHNLKNYVEPSSEQDETGRLVKQSKKTRLKPRVCFIITQKKNSSWVDDICNCEMITKNDHVFHWSICSKKKCNFRDYTSSINGLLRAVKMVALNTGWLPGGIFQTNNRLSAQLYFWKKNRFEGTENCSQKYTKAAKPQLLMIPYGYKWLEGLSVFAICWPL